MVASVGAMALSAVPPGLNQGGPFPTVKTVGYYQSSLRDKTPFPQQKPVISMSFADGLFHGDFAASY